MPPASHRTIAHIALGSNLGDRRGLILAGLRDIDAVPGVGVRRLSEIVETDPVGPPGQGPYLNAVCEIGCELAARALLDAMLEVERRHGRERDREQRWGPRTLDLDIILFGDAVIDEPGLTVPHPRLRERSFVLEPLVQIARDVRVPPDGRTASELLDALEVRP